MQQTSDTLSQRAGVPYTRTCTMSISVPCLLSVHAGAAGSATMEMACSRIYLCCDGGPFTRDDGVRIAMHILGPACVLGSSRIGLWSPDHADS